MFLETRWWKGTRLLQLAVFAYPGRACSSVDTLADRSGECRTRIERAGERLPSPECCGVLRAACCDGHRSHATRMRASANAKQRKPVRASHDVGRFFSVQVRERCAPLWRCSADF